MTKVEFSSKAERDNIVKIMHSALRGAGCSATKAVHIICGGVQLSTPTVYAILKQTNDENT